MTYLPEPVVSPKVERESRIIYRSKDNRREKAFDALEWLAAMTSHIPNPGEKMVGYYGFYSNASSKRDVTPAGEKRKSSGTVQRKRPCRSVC